MAVRYIGKEDVIIFDYECKIFTVGNLTNVAYTFNNGAAETPNPIFEPKYNGKKEDHLLLFTYFLKCPGYVNS